MSDAILSLAVADRSTASSRIRAHLPLDLIEMRGHRVFRVTAREKLWPVRLAALSVLYRPKVIYLQKVMPPKALLSLLKFSTSRLVFDLDDAIYLGYPGDSADQARRARRRIEAGLGFFDYVLTSNEQIRADLTLTGPNCAVFPGPSPQVLDAFPSTKRDRVVMWLGSPSTEANIDDLLPALSQILVDQEFLLVGSARNHAEPGVRRVRWTKTEEVSALSRSHLGLMPLQNTEWNQRKAGYKILEYLRGGVIPVVEEGPILRTLLGDEAETLCEVVSGSSAEHWAAGIQRGLDRVCDESWIAARDRVFARWSMENFAKLILGQITV